MVVQDSQTGVEADRGERVVRAVILRSMGNTSEKLVTEGQFANRLSQASPCHKNVCRLGTPELLRSE